MSRFAITESNRNSDLEREDRELWLKRAIKPYGPVPNIEVFRKDGKEGEPDHPDNLGFLLDFAPMELALKGHAALAMIEATDTDTVSYVAPRNGHASRAIAQACEKLGRRGIFFAPASKQATADQLVVETYKGCEIRFVRTAAMPALNHQCVKWARRTGATHLPMGMKGSSAAIRAMVGVLLAIKKPVPLCEFSRMWMAVSTGTMSRAVQIAYPDMDIVGVQVARNLQDGEKGTMSCVSYDKGFHSPCRIKEEDLPFDTVATYDGKALEYYLEISSRGDLFLNVAHDREALDRVPASAFESADSYRAWNDLSAFEEE